MSGNRDLRLLAADLIAHGWVTKEGLSSEEFVRLAADIEGLVGARRSSLQVDRLTVRLTEEARPGSLSATYGDGAFPFHSDFAHRSIPPRYVLLRSSGTHYRPTLFCDTSPLISRVGASILERSVWSVTKTARPFACSVLFRVGSAGGFRFDQDCMNPATKIAEHCDAKLRDLLQAERNDCAGEVNWAPGRVVVFDNWRMLHARGPRPQTEVNGERVLERIALDWTGR